MMRYDEVLNGASMSGSHVLPKIPAFEAGRVLQSCAMCYSSKSPKGQSDGSHNCCALTL